MRTKLFRTNRTQAVRLPREVAFNTDDEVEIIVLGESRLITPVDHAWHDWFTKARELGGEFPDRAQPEPQGREAL